MVGFARSLAQADLWRQVQNEEGRAPGKRDSRHRKIVESDKVGIIAESYQKVSNNFLPAYQKNSGKTFRAYRACRDITLPPEQRWDQKGKS